MKEECGLPNFFGGKNITFASLLKTKQTMSLNLLHTADWHLGQTFFGYDRAEEHDAFLSWLVDVLEERQTDVLLIAGDVFDVANPSASAQRRFYRFLREANRRNPHLQIIVTAGNHDSASRLETPVPLLDELNTHIIGVVRRTESGAIDFDALRVPVYNKEGRREGWCLAVPYLRQGDYPAPEEETEDTYASGISRMYRRLYEYADREREKGEALVAMGHLYAVGAELSDGDRSERVVIGGLDHVSSEAFPEGLAYTALGHIHMAQRVGGRDEVRYSGSPLPMSFSEKSYRHQVVAVTIEGGRIAALEPIEVPLPATLRRVPEQPLPPEEVLEKLAELPAADAEGCAPQSRWPYVEVRVLLSEPEPEIHYRVEQALEGKAVRLTSVIITNTTADKAEEAYAPSSYGDLQKIDPRTILRLAFKSRYGGELPEDVETLFDEAVREAVI